MKKMKNLFNCFSAAEIALWICSAVVILISFFAFDGRNYIMPAVSLIGVTSLIFNAKGNPFGQFLMIIFSVIYGIISFSCAYYGEMITYLGMTMPMAAVAMVSWLRHPYNGDKSEVEVNRITRKEFVFMWILTAMVTIIFYFILSGFNTANIVPSTISVTTSFAAVYLTFRRSPYYAVGYAANDIVLIVLWSMMSLNNSEYISVVICFLVFLVNDIYGFINWRRIEKRQCGEREN